MNQRILITEPIVESVIKELQKDFSVDVGKRGQFNNEGQLAEAIGDYDALLSMLSNPVTQKVIEAGSKLKIIANHAVGYNNIDVEAAKKTGIRVANTPDVLTEASADLAMALMLSAARHISAAERYLRDGKYEGWEPLGFRGKELHGSTLGILGMGRIGQAVARRAYAFGMHILYHNRKKVDLQIEQALHAEYVPSLEELARHADVLSLHCPLNEATHHIINAEILDMMPNDALLINTSRGAVIDEAALAEALHQGTIGGAGLDVFEHEPEVHSQLLSAPNCMITPHIASATHQTRKAIGDLAAHAIRNILQGESETEISNLLPL